MARLPEPGNTPIFPDATYKVRIVSHERTESKTKRTPQIKWKAEILEPKEHEGRHIILFTVLSEAALWKVSNLISSCGIEFPKDLDTDSTAFDNLCEMTYGRVSYWMNKQREYQGTLQNDIIAFQGDPHQDPIKFVGEAEPEWLDK